MRGGAVAAVVVLLLVPATAGAATRVETPVPSRGDGVVASTVTLSAPMPARTPARPAACDTISYLRLRSQSGPAQAKQSDAVLISMPGILAGAGSMDETGRGVVRAASARGKHFEFWSLDRRSNCLEDHWGTALARANDDPQLAFDYYFKGASFGGNKFAGLATGARLSWLSRMTLAQTIKDEATVISRELPASFRKKKLLCGGHSLGGPLTSALASLDFDGDPRTTADAGWRQCAGFFALDTRLPVAASGTQATVISALKLSDVLGQGAYGSPTLTGGPPLSSEVFQILPVLGLAAEMAPDQQSTILPQLPHNSNFDSALGLLLSRDLWQALTHNPDVRTLRATNAAALAAVFDDNSSPISILRAGLGIGAGGPFAPKQFPVAYNSPPVLGLFGGARLAAPTAYGPKAPLYRWLDWQQSAASAPLRDPWGTPYSQPENEVTDMRSFAHNMAGDGLNFAEQYFPARLVTDLAGWTLGDRSGAQSVFRYPNGVTKKPAIYFDAMRGLGGSAGPVSGPAGTKVVKLPGYAHLDVGTAAEVDATGNPAPIPRELVEFALGVTR